MSLDGRLIGIDDYEFDDYYKPLVDSIQKEMVTRGIDGELIVGSAGQDFKDEIGRSAGFEMFKSYAACVAVTGEAPFEPDFSIIGHELNEIYHGRLSPAPFWQIIDHSDSDGFYIPVDFEKPFKFEKPSSHGDGTWTCDIGSSQALLRELDMLNKHLKMPGDYGDLNGSARLEATIEGDVFAREKWVWAVLHWLARESVARKLLFEFC